MTVLTNKMYEIFDQEEFSFKKLKFTLIVKLN